MLIVAGGNLQSPTLSDSPALDVVFKWESFSLE